MKLYPKPIMMLLLASLFLIGKAKETNTNYRVIPLPQTVKYTQKAPFCVTSHTVISYSQGNILLQNNARFLQEYLQKLTGTSLKIVPDGKGKRIQLQCTLPRTHAETYRITIDKRQITIDGTNEAAVFHGIQTLYKSLDARSPKLIFPSAVIEDSPRFVYRGMHLDVARHFFSVDFIKKYIDILALHNINYFHWHLTDDQGWRIEIKKHPELTGKGAFRKETLIGHLLRDIPHRFDGQPYGGYYTQDEIKDIVQYAAERYITIIPEIDIPGHTLAVLKAYPQLSCTGKNHEVATQWGVFPDVLCAGNDSVYVFLEDVFSELTELFPSKYIHIGGDECPKVRWKECPKCQAKIKALGLLPKDSLHTAESELQAYMVRQVEQILQRRGREIIGWDEILEGELSKDAIVMSWRGTEGGVAAAQRHNRVIMTPHYSLYFDYCQGTDPKQEPLSIGEFLPIKKVYNYEPINSELTDEQAKYVLGMQANLWTEYIKTPQHVEYMLLPRLAALAEVQWTNPEKKDYTDFLRRLGNLLELYKRQGYNFAKHVYGIETDVQPTAQRNGKLVTLSTVGDGKIYYTTDGTLPDTSKSAYTKPITLTNTTTIKAFAIHTDTVSGIFQYTSIFNKNTYKPITLLTTPNAKYAFKGANSLVDGQQGKPSYIDGNWVGFPGKSGMEAIMDLGNEEKISSLTIGNLCDMPNWIFPASSIKVYTSTDGKVFTLIKEKHLTQKMQNSPIVRIPIELNFTPIQARYIKVFLKGTIIPQWHEGRNTPALLFVDEIEIN